MPTDVRSGETLAIRGVLDRAGSFRPRRLGSTTHVRSWPRAEGSELMLELLDREARVLLRERAQVRPRMGCEPGEPREWNVTGYIALREDGASVVLRHKDIVLWSTPIPDSPRMEVALVRRRVTREDGASLRFALSSASEHAFLQVVFQWAERGHRVVAVVPPRETLDLPLEGLPGGRRCRFVVEYSNGLRSTGAATPTFDLPPLGPTLTLVKPARGLVLLPGQPLELEAQVVDPERTAAGRPSDALEWRVDEELVGRGMIAGVDRLEPGRHEVHLRYAPAGAQVVEARTVVRVQAEGPQPPAEDWNDSDEWDRLERG